VTANAIAAIAELSHGRAILGLGAGDSALYGIGLKPQKVAEVEEAIGFFRSHVDRSVPIHLAVSQPRMCELAGRLADGAIVMGPAQPDMVRHQVEWIEAGLKAADRNRKEFEIAFMATLASEPEDIRSWASTQARLLGQYRELPRASSDSVTKSRAASSLTTTRNTCRPMRHTAPPCPTTWSERWHCGHERGVRCAAASPGATGLDALIFPLAGRQRLDRWRRFEAKSSIRSSCSRR